MMTRNSDKLSRLDRRMRELEHAIKHDAESEIISKKADRVRAAVLTALKKFRPAFFEQSDSGAIQKWGILERRWEAISTDEIIAKTRLWGEHVAIRDLRFTEDKT